MFIVKSFESLLLKDDISEIKRLWFSTPSTEYLHDDCAFLAQLFKSHAFKKISDVLKSDGLICVEAWFINSRAIANHYVYDKKHNSYPWHFDMHYKFFGDGVRNIWIPIELYGESHVLEYFDERPRSYSLKLMYCFRSVVSFVERIRYYLSILQLHFICDVVLMLLYYLYTGMLRYKTMKNVVVGCVYMLDPSYLHRTGPCPKLALALQCVPYSKLITPDLKIATEKEASFTHERENIIRNLMLRKALASMTLQLKI